MSNVVSSVASSRRRSSKTLIDDDGAAAIEVDEDDEMDDTDTVVLWEVCKSALATRAEILRACDHNHTSNSVVMEEEHITNDVSSAAATAAAGASSPSIPKRYFSPMLALSSLPLWWGLSDPVTGSSAVSAAERDRWPVG